jgi:hypothetical protein
MPESTLSDLSVVIGATPGSSLGHSAWRIAWTIENRSSAVLSLHEMRIPHDQFCSQDLSIDPPIDIPPEAAGRIDSTVLFAEPPGSTLTYPFVIVRAVWNNQVCRLFGRLRVEADHSGAPHPICEEVTVRPAAGSG